MKKVLSIVILSLLVFSSKAQNTLPRELGGGGSTNFSISGSRNADIIGKEMDTKSIPMEYNRYSDPKFQEMQKEMEEKKWGTEEGAWEKASSIDTRDAYMKYIGMYPSGPHRGEANNRVVELEIEDLMNKAHNDLPGIKQVEKDDDSPTSTIVMENTTQYVMTIRYSGTESSVIHIRPFSKASVTLTNGSYKIAASVPPSHIKPFAGCQDFTGGRYETGYYIVYR